MADYTTAERVRVWLRLAADDPDQSGIAEVTSAANALVTRYAGEVDPVDPETAEALGATMLAARLYRRRNSPEGVQTVTADTALYVARNDPDVSRLLRIDQYTIPQVG